MLERRVAGSREELIQEFSSKGEGGHSPQEVDKVLAAFIDPNNPQAKVEQILDSLTGSILPNIENDPNSLEVAMVLKGLLSDTQDARKFNATYIGHMLSESSIPGFLASVMAMRIGSNTVANEVSITETQLEPEAMGWLAEIVGYDPEKADGTFTSGGSMAMQTALISAISIS